MTTISFLSRLIDFIAPRACQVCGKRLGTDETTLCAKCNMELPRTRYAANAYDNEMARLFWAKIPVERCAALFFYQPGNETSKMIHDLKYHDQPETGQELGRMAAAEFALAGFFDDIDFIVPIPLERKRQRMRGYNQSKEIAKGVAEMTGLSVREDIIERKRDTKSQTRLSHGQRTENVEDAFRLNCADAVKGRHVLIIDDIVTTGSTVCSCGKEIMKAGDVKISVMSLGYTKH